VPSPGALRLALAGLVALLGIVAGVAFSRRRVTAAWLPLACIVIVLVHGLPTLSWPAPVALVAGVAAVLAAASAAAATPGRRPPPFPPPASAWCPASGSPRGCLRRAPTAPRPWAAAAPSSSAGSPGSGAGWWRQRSSRRGDRDRHRARTHGGARPRFVRIAGQF